MEEIFRVGFLPGTIKFPVGMCNTYTLKRDFLKAGRRGGKWNLTEQQIQNIDHGEQWIFRPTKPAPVYVKETGLTLMRWGFERPWAKAINNARIEKANSATWKKAWENGRCLIPLSGWYEFTGPPGKMTAHLLEAVDGSDLLAAGLWEPGEGTGDAFTMVMTESGGVMKELHTRMPIILSEEDAERFLAADFSELRPSGIDVRSRIVPSPLKKRKDSPVQEELF